MTDERKAFFTQWEWEYATTSRVLGNLPPTSLGFRPHPKSMNAGELAWHLVGSERWFATGFLEGRMPEGKWPEAPSSLREMVQAYALQHQELADRVRTAPEEAWERPVPFFGQEIPSAFLLRGPLLNHMIHHRGQFTVYLRLLNAKVPAVYGPSADDSGK